MAKIDRSEFRYEISRNDTAPVIHLSGDMNRKSIALIESCYKEILSKQGVKFVIFNFSGVEKIGGDAVRFLRENSV